MDTISNISPLVHAIIGFALRINPGAAQAQAQAAIDASNVYHAALGLSQRDTAELLLGLAYAESRYDMDALSRIECLPRRPCRRITTVWRKKTKPRYARPSWFCGPVQTGGHVPWKVCQRMREDPAFAYASAAKELAVWLSDPVCRRLRGQKRLVCGIRGYAGGYAAVKKATLSYPYKIFKLSKLIHRRVDQYTAKNTPRT